MSEIKYDFLISQVSQIRDIKEDDKIKISVVFYEETQSPCVLKVCKNRDMTEVYQKMMDIRHPNMVTVYDVVYANNNTYIIEEFVSGKTLYEVLQEHGKFSEREIAQMMIDICGGLELLHECQPPIIHNDIKTSNIMVREDGTVKLIDFDIARSYKEGAIKNTKLMGTEEYAAPEHFGFGQSEPCTDVYGLGVTMHELLTGVALTNERKMTYKGSLRKIIQRCIEVNREKRYASAKLLRKELERFLKKKKIILPLCIALAILLILGVALGFWQPKDSRHSDKRGNTVFELLHGDNQNDVKNDETSDKQLENQENDETSDDFEKPEITTKDNTQEKDKNNEVTDGQQTDTNSNQTGPQDNDKEIVPETGGQEGNQTNNQSGNTTTTTNTKKVNTVCSVSGTLHTMIAVPDMGFVTLEKISGTYHVKTSSGKEKTLGEVGGSYGCRLTYNSYSDKLYLLEYNNNSTKIYEMDKNLNIDKKATFSGGYYIDKSHLACNFFSDGTMVCNPLFQMINCDNWTFMGQAPGSSYVIGDKLYKRGSSAFFVEVDMAGNTVKEYDGDFFATVYNDQIFVTGNYAYFIGTANKKDYLYRFDGTSFTQVACLNDYQYYASFSYSYLSVSEDAFRCYDTNNKVIKEFKLK